MKSPALLIIVAIIIGASAGSGAYYYFHKASPAANNPAQCTDPNSISSHVYNPDRLDVVNSCIKASGVVENVFDEADGDYHLRLALDSNYSSLINDGNRNYQYGDLVVEIICATSISQQDAVSACQGYTNNITVPSVGDHITVTGPYVLDTDHYGWAEIHPVYSLTIG